MSILPTLIIFDLDYTLWPFYVDTHVTPPFTKNRAGKVVDSYGKEILHYKDVPIILEKLKNENIKIGIASRTSEIDGANQLLNLFNWDKYISFKQIFPGSKITHFKNIQKSLNIEYKNIIFFDDERRNIKDVEQLGVLCILVDHHGMTIKVLEEALKQYELKQLAVNESKSIHTDL